jgi:hypothetical protein
MQLIGTHAFPTSPSAKELSVSYPVCVGKSKATDKPLTPWFYKNGIYKNM